MGERGSTIILEETFKKGHLVKLPKGKTEYLCWLKRNDAPIRVIIRHRLGAAVDSKLRENQAEFRQNRVCADQIRTLRIILEQSEEIKSPLCIVLVDFKKSFDTLHGRRNTGI